MPVTLDVEKKEICITDIGVTLRTLLAVAGAGLKTSGTRKWSIVYRGVKIGQIQAKDHEHKDAKRKTIVDRQTPKSTTNAPAEPHKTCQSLSKVWGVAEGSAGSQSAPVVRKLQASKARQEHTDCKRQEDGVEKSLATQEVRQLNLPVSSESNFTPL